MDVIVKKPFGYEERINVVVNGVCNHYGAELEQVNIGQGDQDDMRELLVCTCGMIQDVDGIWVQA